MSHTPGPWQVEEYDTEDIEVVTEIMTHIAFCNNTGEGHANAHLIAAAPELLEALERFVETIKLDLGIFPGQPRKESVLGQAMEAIKKARGE